MFSYEGPVNTIDLGSRVNDCGGVNVFHSEGGDDKFHFNVQRILSLGVLRMVTGSSGVEAVLPFKNPDYMFPLGWRAIL